MSKAEQYYPLRLSDKLFFLNIPLMFEMLLPSVYDFIFPIIRVVDGIKSFIP